MKTNRGQVTITVATILGAIGLISGALSGYFSAQMNTQKNIDNAKTELRAVDATTMAEITELRTTEALHYKELSKDTDEIKADVKTVLLELRKR